MVDAREYHERTKHSPESVRGDSFTLDVSNKPRPSKAYVDLPRVSLSVEHDPPAVPALEAIANPNASPVAGRDTNESTTTVETENLPPSPPAVTVEDLQAMCHYATGITKHLEVQGRRTPFRAAACTGKLYHIDLYAVTGPLSTGPGTEASTDEPRDPDAETALAAGIYHFDPESGDFDVVREGDYRPVLAAATGGYEAVMDAPVTFVTTSQWWRNAWKYRARTFRHAFWDSGTILANLLATAHALGHRAEIVMGFADDPVAELLGLDPDREAPLELVPVGSDGQGNSETQGVSVERIDPAEVPLSDTVVDYPLVPDAWRQSSLSDGSAAADWRRTALNQDQDTMGTHGIGDGEIIELAPVDDDTASSRPIGRTIERRGSLREYSHEPISHRLFATVLDRAFRGVPVDSQAGGDSPGFIDVYTLVHAVEGVQSGAYQYHPGESVLERLDDTSRDQAGRLALGQSVVGDAAANVYVMADIDAVVESLGNRGYRLAQLLGGISLGRLYLGTYAHRAIGGRGFTFFDDLVTEAFSPRAANQTPMTLFAFGKPDRD